MLLTGRNCAGNVPEELGCSRALVFKNLSLEPDSIFVDNVVCNDSPISLGLTGQFQRGHQVRLVKARKYCVTKICFEPSFKVLLFVLMLNERSQTDAVSPIPVQEEHFDRVELAWEKALNW